MDEKKEQIIGEEQLNPGGNSGDSPKKPFYRKIPGYRSGKVWKMVIASIAYGFIILMIVSPKAPTQSSKPPSATTSQAKTNSTNPAPAETKKDNAIQSGTYKVGKDISAGEYVVVSNGSSGYIELTKDSSGQLDSIICNDMFQHRSIITANNGEYLKIQSSKAYPIDNAPKVNPTNGILPSGMYKVGLDLSPGEYKVQAAGDGYVEVAGNSRHTLTGIVSNDMFSGGKYVTVRDGQYIKLQGAELVLK